MLENNTTRMLLLLVVLVIFIGAIWLLTYFLSGGDNSLWSFLSWDVIRQSSADI